MSEALPNAGVQLPNPNAGPYSSTPSQRNLEPKPNSLAMISPAQHAILDYAVAGTFFAAGKWFSRRHRPAAQLAYLNGAMVLGMSLLTDYQGGLFREISFRTGHRTGDIIQAALAGLGPMLFGFASDREAEFFYAQALSEVGVIATTDWNGRVD